MPRTAGGLRTETSRLAELEKRRPEWGGWLEMLEEVEEVASRQSPVTSDQSPVAGRQSVTSRESGDGSPLLQHRVLRVDGSDCRRLIIRLLKKASELDNGGSLRGYRPSDEESIELLAAAVRQDWDAITAVALASGAETGALASVAHLAALPLLRVAGRELRDEIPKHWPHGYCPVCAAWPVLAERRGLDRSRRLRCGRCASEWEMEWLTCVYCGERDHQRLGSLVSEDGDEALKVETCERCKGYLKSIATLQAIPAFELLLRDLETVELDLITLERGYKRPEERGFVLETAVL
jgi:FdhE protein